MSEGEGNPLKPFDANPAGGPNGAIIREYTGPIFNSLTEKNNADLARTLNPTLNINDARRQLDLQEQETSDLTLAEVEIVAGGSIAPYFPEQISGYDEVFNSITFFLKDNKDKLHITDKTFHLVFNGELVNGVPTPTPLPDSTFLPSLQISVTTKAIAVEPVGNKYTLDGVRISYNYPMLEALGMADSSGNALAPQNIIDHIYPILIKDSLSGKEGMQAVLRDAQGKIVKPLGKTFSTNIGPEGFPSYEWGKADIEEAWNSAINDFEPKVLAPSEIESMLTNIIKTTPEAMITTSSDKYEAYYSQALLDRLGVKSIEFNQQATDRVYNRTVQRAYAAAHAQQGTELTFMGYFNSSEIVPKGNPIKGTIDAIHQYIVTPEEFDQSKSLLDQHNIQYLAYSPDGNNNVTVLAYFMDAHTLLLVNRPRGFFKHNSNYLIQDTIFDGPVLVDDFLNTTAAEGQGKMSQFSYNADELYNLYGCNDQNNWCRKTLASSGIVIYK